MEFLKNNNMKILIILVRREGGVGKVVNSIKPILKERGHLIEVISREDDLDCYSLRGSFKKMREEVKKRDYDILYTQDWSCALPFLFWKNHYTCFHGSNPNKVGRFFQTFVGQVKEKKLIVVGDKLKKKFPKSNLIYNGVDFNKFKDLNNRRDKIGWINKDAEGITKGEFFKIAYDHGLEPTIAKNIPQEKMNEWYNSLKVFVSYPTKIAGFNLCWLEAKAAGVPKVLGNENGVGISKVEKDWKEMNWEVNVNKLLKIMGGLDK